MKIIKFLGGLGNQMFQYACYKALEKKYPNVKADLNSFTYESHHNGFELENIFDLNINKISSFTGGIYDIQNKKWIYRKIRRILFLKGFHKEEQNHFRHDPMIFSDSKSKYYYGFWQNEQYFIDIADEIRKDFKFKPPSDQQNIDILDRIKQTNSVGVHVRRGDYVSHPSFGGLCEKGYYQKAIQLIQSKIDAPKYFIFSNDINWCKENLEIKDCIFVSWNVGLRSFIDMQLMSACKHNIIANSSFSWWGAWLNNNPNKIVIGPKKWLKDDRLDTSTLLPADWIRL